LDGLVLNYNWGTCKLAGPIVSRKRWTYNLIL